MIINKIFNADSLQYAKDLEYNMSFLRVQQNYFNDSLQMRGHVFLNEVYDMLGLPRTREGATHGWAIKGMKKFISFAISVCPSSSALGLQFDVEEILDFIENEAEADKDV